MKLPGDGLDLGSAGSGAGPKKKPQ